MNTGEQTFSEYNSSAFPGKKSMNDLSSINFKIKVSNIETKV